MKRMIAGALLATLLAACSAKVDGDGAEVKINKDSKRLGQGNLEQSRE
jgi:hypothetical protein